MGAKADTELANAAGERPIDLARALLASPGEFDDPTTLEKMIALLQVCTTLFQYWLKQASFSPPSAGRSSTPRVLETLARRLVGRHAARAPACGASASQVPAQAS